MKKNTIFFIVVLLIVAGLSFFAGIKYQESRRSQFFSNRLNAGAGFTNLRNRAGIRPINGEILNISEKSMTVKLRDGSSKIVLFSDKTIVNKSTQASKDDLKTGENVNIIGQENTDGSVTADSIQLGFFEKGRVAPTSNK